MEENKPLLKVWGRRNSVNVQKLLWCCEEIGVPFERIDAGMEFGVNDQPEYLAMNPNGRVPAIDDGGFVLWESNAVLRYLALRFDGTLYPQEPRLHAGIDRWLDWTISTLLPVERSVFLGTVRTPREQRNEPALRAEVAKTAAVWRIFDRHLGGRMFAEGDRFTIADICLGCFATRWFKNTDIERVPMDNLQRWYEALAVRPAFQDCFDAPLS